MSFQVSNVPDYINVNSIFAGMVMKEKPNSVITTTVFGMFDLKPAALYHHIGMEKIQKISQFLVTFTNYQ